MHRTVGFKPIFRTRPMFFPVMCMAWATAMKGRLQPMLGIVMWVPALVHVIQRRTQEMAREWFSQLIYS